MFKRSKDFAADIAEIRYEDATILPNNRWAVYVSFQLIGMNEKKVHNDKIYTLVCSANYKEHPLEEEPSDEKTIVMEYLDKEHLESRIRKIIEEINKSNCRSWEDYYRILEKYFHVDD